VNGQIGWTDLFWSAAGRLARTPFLLAAAALILVAAIYGQLPLAFQWLTGWLVYPALIWSGACVLSKRLHDRGRSGWWAALVLFAFAAEWARPFGFSGVAYILVLAWAAIELGVMQGEDGANRFGPSPMALAV
jgi:uncharacterized membrane protein YhaH (DUF805 family)